MTNLPNMEDLSPHYCGAALPYSGTEFWRNWIALKFALHCSGKKPHAAGRQQKRTATPQYRTAASIHTTPASSTSTLSRAVIQPDRAWIWLALCYRILYKRLWICLSLGPPSGVSQKSLDERFESGTPQGRCGLAAPHSRTAAMWMCSAINIQSDPCGAARRRRAAKL